LRTETDAKISLFIGIPVALILILTTKNNIESEMLSNITKAVSITLLIRMVYVKWLWKFLPEIIHGTPLIEGTWEGRFISNWQDPKTGSAATGLVNVRIIQPSLFEIKLRQSSNESESISFGELLAPESDGVFFLNFSFKNDPNAIARAKSPVNYGFAKYKLSNAGPNLSLEGNYFTDRQSAGTVTLQRTSCKP